MTRSISPYPDTYPAQYWHWQASDDTTHRIHYVHAGTPHADRPALLLVHGFGASTDHWRKNIDTLKQEFDVWAIDLLGFGRSAKPDIPYSGDLWRDQLQAFITDVIRQPTAIAGNSLGGYAALNTAATYPEMVAGVVLLNSAGPFNDGSNLKNRQPSPVQRLVKWFALQDWVAYLIFQNTRRKTVIRKTLEKVYLDKTAVTDRLVDEIFRPSGDPGAAQVFASVFKTPRGATVDELLAQLVCPLMTIWGEGDPWMKTRDRGAKFREFYPSVTEHYIEAGHCPHDEVPEVVNRLIYDWALGLAVTSAIA
ncbi:MAG: alpha/beta fold hydrolase [Coleofasciculaceae cyanobacterium RL_1_1]|nr:alpha/beta fold hydrolase [Coleofasciculaceae cyanobacterium RL_1_1]